ncbi:hypothetical protein [Altererythrobacter fulvus]|uniref:hypothetical protein n=1 Tax=Caenibius fulvus TaxID=2126012 RepID=UPI00301AEBB4
MYGDRTPLFCSTDGMASRRAYVMQAGREVANLSEDRILNTDPDDLTRYFVEKYRVNVPVLDRENMVAEQHEREIEFYSEWERRAVMVPGEAYDFVLPFDGDASIFNMRPNSFDSAPPYASVSGATLKFTISGRELPAEKVKAELDKLLASIERYLGWHRSMWTGLDDEIARTVRSEIDARRNRLLNQKQNATVLAGLGIKLKEKPGDPKTYVPPAVKQKIKPQMPPMQPAKPPEPVLDEAQYATILGLIRDAGRSVERGGERVRELDEETLRDMFLIPLNSHFEGVTGEAFNHEGKTDVLLRYEGGNLFVAEFKIWSGAKAFGEAIDQLLSYLTWRETKAAIVIFSRNKGFTSVLEAIREAAQSHNRFVSGPKRLDDTSDRYVFSLPQDDDRLVNVSVLAFDLSSS